MRPINLKQIGKLFTTSQGDGLVLICFFLILSVQTLSLFAFDPTSLYNFGAEYGRIAGSIVKGDGFANVFGAESGPTAWHPPLTVFFYSLIFALFGTQSLASIWVLLFFRNVFLTVTLYYLFRIIDNTRYAKYRSIVVIILLVQIFTVKLLSYNVEDIEIAIMLSSMIVYAVLFVDKDPRPQRILIYILAFVLPLTVPSFALSFALLLFIIFCRNFIRNWKLDYNSPGVFLKNLLSPKKFANGNQKWFATIILTGAIFIASASIWSYRNYLVFDQFIPIKSNLWFEFYLANNPNADGLYSFSKLNLDHPYRNEKVIQDYVNYGEIEFIENRKEMAQAYVKLNPDHFFQNTLTRFKSAFIWTDMVKDVRNVDLSLFSNEEIQEIHKTRLLLDTKWTSLNMTEEGFLDSLQSLSLQREEEVFKDWKDQKKLYLDSKYSITNIVSGLLLALIPVLFMIVGMSIKVIRNSRVFKIVIGIYFIHLLPYVLISHWYRYQLFLLALQALIMFIVISQILNQLRHSPSTSSKSSLSTP